MAKNNDKAQADKKIKTPRDYSKTVVLIKVVVLFVLMFTSLYMAGMLQISQMFVQWLGYGVMAVTIYFALSSVK